MISDRPAGARWGARLSLVVTLAFGLLALSGVLQGDLKRTAAALIAFALVTRGRLAGLIAAGLCLGFSEFEAAGLAAVGVFASQLAFWSRIGARRDVDSDGLRRAFASLPPGLVADLRILAAGEPVTTWHMVRWARDEAPRKWPEQAGTPTADEFDGVLLAGGVTQFAAEAAVLARHFAEAMEVSIDEQVLGVAATCIPLSTADEMYRKPPVEEVLRMSDRQFADAFLAFGRSALGGPTTARVERVMRLPSWQREAFSREQIASLTPTRATLAQLATAGVYVWAVGSVLLDGVKALRPRRWRRTTGDNPAPARASRALTQAPEKPVPSPSGATKARRKPPLQRVRTALSYWQEMPPVARVLWVSRPAFVLVALILPLVLGTSPWWSVFPTALVAGVRGVRYPVLAALALVALAFLSWLAPAVLAVRLVVGEVALRCCGRTPGGSRRAAGVARVVGARRRLARAADLEAASFDEARTRRVERLHKGAVDEDEQFEFAANLIGAAWAEMRPQALASSLLRLWRGGVLGRWGEGAAPPDMEAGVRHLYLLSEVGEFVLRAGLIVAAGAAAGAVAEPQSWILADHGVVARLPAALFAALVTKSAGSRPPSLTGAAFWSVAAGVAMRSDALLPVVIGVGGAAITQTAKSALEGGLTRGWNTPGWNPPRRTPRRLRARWKAAQQAADQGRFGLGVDLVDQAAALTNQKHVVFRNDCHAQAALWLLELGEVGAAARRLDRLEAEQPDAMSAPARYSLGLAKSRVGDDDGAATELRAALTEARDAVFARRIAVSLAEVLARQGEAKQAVAVLSEHPPSALGAQGMATMVDAETAVVVALRRAGDEPAASARLETILDFASFGDDAVGDPDRGLADAQGRAFLLAGRWALGARQTQSAEKHLDQAHNWLKGGHDEYARATARVLHGCALTRLGRRDEGVQAIEAGLAVLEGRRTKLEQGDRRATMIVAGEETYGFALDALSAANGAGHNHAGLVGAVLIESLRRSAISQALRQGPGLLDETLGPLAYEIASLDDGAGTDVDVTDLRLRLANQVNERFADAYLPSTVTATDLADVARDNGHLLSFHIVPSARSAWRAWMTPDGTATVDAVEVPDDPDHILPRLRRGDALTRLELFAPWDPDVGAFAQLSRALLPKALADTIGHGTPQAPLPLLVVPDGYLAGVPWSALPVAGQPLVTKALVQLSPSLDLLGPAIPRVGPRSVLAFPEDGAVGELSATTEVLATRRRESFLHGLSSQRHAGAYIGTHGEGSGMDARVSFGAGEWLSAASALRYRWPEWVVFAACVVGRFEPQSGKEPLGMPISCMLGGASAVIAAVVEIAGSEGTEQTPASRLAASVTAALADREDPARALRSAQLDYLARTNMPTVGEGLGAVCLSSRPMKRVR